MNQSQPIGQAFEAMLSVLVDQAAERLLSQITPLLSQPAVSLDDSGLEPLRVYSAKEVARMLGTKRVASIYEIPELDLPRVRRIGSGVGFLGINVLAYMHGLPPVDVASVVERYRERLLRERPAVRPLRPDRPGKTRVL